MEGIYTIENIITNETIYYIPSSILAVENNFILTGAKMHQNNQIGGYIFEINEANLEPLNSISFKTNEAHEFLAIKIKKYKGEYICLATSSSGGCLIFKINSFFNVTTNSYLIENNIFNALMECVSITEYKNNFYISLVVQDTNDFNINYIGVLKLDSKFKIKNARYYPYIYGGLLDTITTENNIFSTGGTINSLNEFSFNASVVKLPLNFKEDCFLNLPIQSTAIDIFINKEAPLVTLIDIDIIDQTIAILPNNITSNTICETIQTNAPTPAPINNFPTISRTNLATTSLSNSEDKEKGLSAVAIVFIVIGSILGGCLILLILFQIMGYLNRNDNKFGFLPISEMNM